MIDTKQLDVTARCENCGGLKKEHHKRAPYRCPTRLKESYWKPWTVEGYEQAAKASADKAEADRVAADEARKCPFCRIEHKAMVPTIHMNGTSAHELRDQFQAAIEALRLAQRRVIEAAPNGRDYYLQAGNAAGIVIGQHERRCSQLNAMIADLQEQREHVEAVLDFQAEQRASREVRP